MEYSVQSNPEMSYIDLKNMHLPGSKAGPKAGLPKGSAMNYLTLRLEHFFWTPPSPVPAFFTQEPHFIPKTSNSKVTLRCATFPPDSPDARLLRGRARAVGWVLRVQGSSVMTGPFGLVTSSQFDQSHGPTGSRR